MDRYTFKIKEHLVKAYHLSNREDLIYRRLLEVQYLTERAISGDLSEIAKSIRMGGSLEDVSFVLSEFFEFSEGVGWEDLGVKREIESKNNKCAPYHGSYIKRDVVKPDNVSIQVWEDFTSYRRASKSLLTSTGLKAIEREALKAGWTLERALELCVAMGWKGFKAGWVKDEKGEDKFVSFGSGDLKDLL